MKLTGDKCYQWKGDNVGYFSLHRWVRKHLGNPMKCSKCGTEKPGRYEWANISGEYKRSKGFSDWVRVCRMCHVEMDKHTVARGDKLPQTKLTPEEVVAIRDEYAKGDVTQRSLEEKYGIRHNTLWCILHRKTWKHVGGGSM